MVALGFVLLRFFLQTEEAAFLLWTVACGNNKQKRKHPVRND